MELAEIKVSMVHSINGMNHQASSISAIALRITFSSKTRQRFAIPISKVARSAQMARVDRQAGGWELIDVE